MNGYGKRRRCTDDRQIVVEFYCYLAARSSSSAI